MRIRVWVRVMVRISAHGINVMFRLFFLRLRLLNSFGVKNDILHVFYT